MGKTQKARARTRKKTRSHNDSATPRKKTGRVARPFPRATIEDATKIPFVIKEKNGGNPWTPGEIASALGMSKNTNAFFYMAAASRDFGFTDGGRDSNVISLTDLGRDLAYAPNKETENQAKRKAFQSIDIFNRVLDYYKGSKLPEMRYLSNTLQREFQLDPDTHEEFSTLFRQNCEYLNIGEGYSVLAGQEGEEDQRAPHGRGVVTLAEPETMTGL